VRRRSASQAIILSISDFERILAASEVERKKLEKVIREVTPVYSIGESITEQQV